MADIRIKDLTTTASSSASDDFIAVDGTTNGTRKLNAYSPSFGGNATVGGTLTATNGITVGEDAQITNSATVASGTRLTINTKAQQGIDIYRADANANYSGIRFRNSANSATNAQIGWSGTTLRLDATTVEVPGTTASTSTSTGALVVSGGVGVGGAINAGGNISLFSANVLRLYNSGNTGYISIYNFGERLNINYPTSLVDTTASTSTSTGALVVSGGVGVAGAVHVGGTARIVGSSHTLRLRHDTSIVDFSNTAENAYVTGTIIGSTLQLWGNNGTGLIIGTTGNATFAGNITTAAPAGGTAAAWKLGTVASVSPTSPNRTIEVDIGGTVYYIHAKTTNN